MAKYYFFDRQNIAEESNTETRFAQPQKTATNAVWTDPMCRTEDSRVPEWEYRVSILYPYVLYDENGSSADGIGRAKYKMWYYSNVTVDAISGRNWLESVIDKNNSRGVELCGFKNSARGEIGVTSPDFYSALCYMESNDGINWRRPDCGEFYYKKSDGSIVGTNLVMIGEHGAGVTKNTHPLAGKGEPRFILACAMEGVGISASEDGIHWQKPVRIIGDHDSDIYIKADTHNQIFWSEEVGKYVVITRGFEEDLRVVAVAVGPDRLYPHGDADMSSAGRYFSAPSVALRGALGAQPYSMPIYRLCKGYYLGIVSILDFDESKEEPYHVHASLAWSRDGIGWEYICTDKPFLQNAADFRLERGNDFGMIYSAAPVKAEGKMKIYYAAIPELHYFSYDKIPLTVKGQLDAAIPKAKELKKTTRNTTLNLATVDTDRFAGVFTEDGKIRTKPFPLSEGAVLLTADVLSGGEIRARLLDENGTPVRGSDYSDMPPITSSVTEALLTASADPSVIGREVSLEISVKNAVLYSYEVKIRN